MTFVLQGRGGLIEIDPNGPARIIGERINPSGRSRLRQALLDGDWEYVATEARRQVDAGAEVVDVNVGGKGIDEKAVLPRAVEAVASAVTAPVSIDAGPASAPGSAGCCPGRPLVNSIGGEKKSWQKTCPPWQSAACR